MAAGKADVMTLQDRVNKIRKFTSRALVALPGDERGGSLPARIIRVGHLLFRGYMDDDLTIHASSLTFVTLTSLVPILAVGFALIKGFGMGQFDAERLAEFAWFTEMPDQWQQFVHTILGIVNTTNFAALGWIGLAFFVLTAVLLLANVEKSYNRVWGVDKNRSLLRQIANYTSVLVLMPLLIGLVGALKARIAFNQQILGVDANAWVQNVAAFGIMWLAIGFLYVFVPNTRVRLRPAVFSSLLTAVIFLGWIRMFTVLQVGVTNYNKIYGAFAAVPVFMLWLYVTWVILLLGAEFTFALQNSDTYRLESAADTASMRARILVALMILRQAGRAMDGGKGFFDVAEFARQTKAPIRLINTVVAMLARRGYLTQVASRDASYVLIRTPDSIRLHELVNKLMREGGSHAELEASLTVDTPLKETLAKIEQGAQQRFGYLTFADLEVASPS